MDSIERWSARLAATWALEIAAAVLSAGALAATVGVLVAANGRSVNDWKWHNITLNALVSVLATISRVSALYILSSAIGQTKWILFNRYPPASLLDFEAIDLASRGSAGCAQFLFRAKRV